MKAKRHEHPNRVLVRKWFDGLPIVEAKHELRIQPNPQDIKNAKKGDPSNCVFSKACKRMWGSSKVIFFGKRAYVDLLDAKGNRRIERFTISSAGQRMIKEFDAGKKIDPQGFVLLPPGKGNTAEVLRARAREQYRRKPRTNKDGSRPKARPSHARYLAFVQHP